MKKNKICFAFGWMLFLLHSVGFTQSYPTHPIKVLIPFPPGGGVDIVTRIVVDQVSKNTDINFVLENRSGAGGNIAFAAAATAPPDGYTLLLSTPGLVMNTSLYANAGFKQSDFSPIILLAEAPLVLMVRPSLGINSVSELIQASRAAPDALRFASAGNGSSSHLATEVLKTMTALQYLHVPYRGSVVAMTDAVAGRVEMTTQPVSESLPFIRDKRLLPLAQTGATRSPIAPDIPTMQEQGVKDYAVTTWYMLLGPAKMPSAVIDKLHQVFGDALKMPSLRQSLESKGLQMINDGPEQATKFLYEQTASWKKIIETSGMKID